jgi:hypothetical protein
MIPLGDTYEALGSGDASARISHWPALCAARRSTRSCFARAESTAKWARTHQIDDIPSAETIERFGAEESPNACLLWHLEKLGRAKIAGVVRIFLRRSVSHHCGQRKILASVRIPAPFDILDEAALAVSCLF